MKCDELKPLVFSIADLAYVDEIRVTKNFQNPHDHAVYKAAEVDAAIAELKRENESLVKCCKEYDSRQRIDERIKFNNAKQLRSTKRALWLMTAEWAEAMGLASCNIAIKFMSQENFQVSDDYRNKTIKKYRHRQVVFYKYADYCRQKAEKYK